MRKRKLKERALAGVLALATALSPVGSSLTVYAEEPSVTTSIIEVAPETEAEETTATETPVETVAEDSLTEVAAGEVMEAEPLEESYTISIDLADFNGSVTVKDGDETQTARISEDADGNTVVSVKKNGNNEATQSMLTAEQPYALVVEAEAGTAVNVKAEADEGFEVSTYSVTMDGGADVIPSEEIGFRDGFIAFEYDVLATEDRVVTVDFAELPETEGQDDGITITDETEEAQEETSSETEEAVTEEAAEETAEEEPETVPAEEETSIEEAATEGETSMEEETSEEEASTEETAIEEETSIESETSVEEETSLEETPDGIEVETEAATEEMIEEATEAIEIEEEVPEAETEELFMVQAEGVEELNTSDFSTKRLVLLAEDDSIIIDPENIQDQYGEIYVLEYGTVQQAMNAYVYYKKAATAVEPDRAVSIASETTDYVETAAGEAETNLGLLIALIDTGAQLNGNVIAQASVIDDVMYGNGHGDAMAAAITSVNPAARILSIRAMDDNGHGTLASIVSAIEYAINNGAQVINLSLYSRKSLTDSVLAAQIQKAVSAGITVVAAAGNAGDDAANYMPGCVEEAYVIGACDETGAKIASSNYGSTVDYNVVAESTSEAAAKFSAYVSMHGLPVENVNENGLVFSNGYEPPADVELPDGMEDAEYIGGIAKPVPFYIALPLNTSEGFEDSFDLESDFALEFAEGLNPEDYEVAVESVDENFDKNVLGTYDITYTITPKDGGEAITVPSVLVVTDYRTEEGMNRLAEELAIADLLDEEGLLSPQYLADADKYPGDPNLYAGEGGTLPDDYYDFSIPYFENKYVLFADRFWYDGEAQYASDAIEFEDSQESDFTIAYNCGHNSSLEGTGSATVLTNGQSSWRVRFNSGPLRGKTITMYCHAHTAASLYAGKTGTYKYYADGYVHFHTPDTCTGARDGMGRLTDYQCACARTTPPTPKLYVKKTSTNPDPTRELTTNNSNYPQSVINTIKKNYGLSATFAFYKDRDDAEAMNDNYEFTVRTNSNGSVTKELDRDQAGKYYVRELRSPNLMYPRSQIKEVNIKVGSTTNVTYSNRPLMLPLIIKKTDATGQIQSDLAGTVFTIYTDADCTERAKFYSQEDEKWLTLPQLVVGADGIASTADGDWYVSSSSNDSYLNRVEKANAEGGLLFPYGATIYIKETRTMSGYIEPTEPIRVTLGTSSAIVRDVNGNLSGYNSPQVTIPNEKEGQPPTISVRKSAVTSNAAITQLNGGTNPLYADLTAEFVICDANGNPVRDQNGQQFTFTTNAQGVSPGITVTTIDPSSAEATAETRAMRYLPAGTYYMKETKAPTNYALSNCPSTRSNLWPFTITSAGGNVVVNIQDNPVNDPNTILIRKQDQKAGTTGKPAGAQVLQGAEFTLSYWAETTPVGSTTVPSREPDMVWTYTTLSNGYLDIQDPACKTSGEFIATATNGVGIFPVGTYLLEETKAPNGFVQPTAGRITLVGHNNHTTGQEYSEFTWAVDSILFNYNASQGYIALYEPAIYTDIAVRKQDTELREDEATQGDASLAGITFGIWNMNSNPVFVNGTEYPAGSEIVALRMVTDESGYATTKGKVTGGSLPVGKYQIREVSSNESMQKTDTSVVEFEILGDGSGIVLEDGTRLARNNDNPPIIREYDANSYTARDNVVEGGIEIQKVDADTGTTEVSGDATFEGAVFSIINASDEAVINRNRQSIPTAKKLLGDGDPSYEDLMAAIETGSLVQTITTNENGYASTGLRDLPYGTYYVIETAAPEGYLVNTEWIKKVEIREQGVFVSLLNEPCADTPIKGGVKVQKFDYMRDTDQPHGDTNLAGAEFTIVNASKNAITNFEGERIPTSGISGNVTYSQIRAAAENSTVQVLTTDELGDAQTGDHDLPYGTYYIIETKAPEGYSINTGWIGEVVIREDGVIYEPVVVQKGIHDESNHDENEAHDVNGPDVIANDGHGYAANNQIYRAGIIIDKIDLEMGDATSQGEATLAGAEFTIINASAASVRNAAGEDIPAAEVSETPTYAELREIADAGENTVQVITTNREGRASTGSRDLPYGTYYVIETKSSEGYYIDETFVGRVIVRDNDLSMTLGTTEGNSSFVDINDVDATTVDQQVRRSDLNFLKVNIDGEYKPYIPFLISAIRVNADGSETVLESHVIVSDANGYVDTSRPHSNNTNGFDQYIENGTVTPEGEELLEEASTWGIWFQGNITDYPKDAVNDKYGALYDCHYRITELHCEDNKGLEENLLASDLIDVKNDLVDVTELMGNNAKSITYHPLVDTEIELTSQAIDTESDTKTLPARESVEIQDTVQYTHVSADHKYRLEVQFRDLTDGGRVIKVQGTNDPDASVSEDGAWVTKEFQPEKQSGTNNTYGEISISALLNTKALNGHTIMAVDYLYEYIDITDNDMVPGDWVLVKVHPAEGEVDEDQCVYVPDLKTKARDSITGDREGAKSEEDGIIDEVTFSNLSRNEQYVITMTLMNRETGEPIVTDADGNAVLVTSDVIFRRDETPVTDTITLPEFKLDSSGFENNMAVVVVESLYRADEDGNPMGEPIMVHDSLLDEDQTIRWADVQTTASDKNTVDDVGTSETEATVYDVVKASNVIFDDNDHEGPYTYTLKGHLVYQKDFTDADGVEHKAGEQVETLEGTKDVVTITSDAAGNATFTYADGTPAKGTVTIKRYGMNVGNSIGSDPADNSYITDNTAAIADFEVELIFKIDSSKLEGGTVVAFETLYHDATGGSDTEIAKHEDITDKGQTVHYPHVRTSAVADATQDDVGALMEFATITDTVMLTNLVPGRDYTVSGKLVDQETGKDFLVDGRTVTQRASFHVSEDGEIVPGNGERVTVIEYNEELNEVSGTIDLVFTFDATGLEDRTCVVFEDLYHNGVIVACHNDLTDDSQTVHFPKIRTTLVDGDTGDHVANVGKEATLVDTVVYSNLVPGREYTISGVLMDKDTHEALLDPNGEEVTATRTFTAGEEGDGVTITELDEEHNKVSGTVEITFRFDASLLEGKTVVAFEDLKHNGVNVTTHTDIEDEAQTVHYPKIRTSAMDGDVGDEVGKVDQTKIVDKVRFWNLIPGMEYEVSGTLMDKATGQPLLVDGETVTQQATIKVNEDGTVTSGNGEKVTVLRYDEKNNYVDGTIELTFEFDASGLEDTSVVVFEKLFHKKVEVTVHEDLTDLGQTVHFPEIHTNAVDVETGDHAGTVGETTQVRDTVTYNNLVIGKTYTIKGTLMNQATGAPVINPDGTPVTAEATFVASTESSGDNKVTNVDTNNPTVDGEYTLTFVVDSRQLAGETVVVFEDLYHNNVKVTTHSDIHDEAQSVHYPEIHTTAVDSDTGDHVGSIWGALINGVKQFFGDTDADGNGVPDDRQANIIDTVTLENLVPGYTYVVSGKLYDAGASQESGEAIPLEIDGEEIVQAVTITVAEDGRSITASGGEETSVISYDEVNNRVDGTVDLVYSLDSSKIQGVETVVFERLYHDVTYTPDIQPEDVEEEDIIHVHEDYTDKGQSVSEVDIHTTAVDMETGGHVGAVPQEGSVSVIHDEVNLAKLVPGMDYRIEGVLVDIGASDMENGEPMYLKADGTLTADREEAYTETYRFTAEKTEEKHFLNFALSSDKVQGRTLTVFEDLYHGDVKISSHPAGDGEGWDEEAMAPQTVYYPTGKTNATDNTTEEHMSIADSARTITDRVYFENLLVGETYEIHGSLVYQSDFTDAKGVFHQAGDPVGSEAAVRFEASENLTSVPYIDGATGSVEYEDGNATAAVDSLTVTTYANGQKAISGYVSLEFIVDASALEGATIVAFESFYNNGAEIFVHEDLEDYPQTIRIPKIRTTAKVDGIDEAAVYDENGDFRIIEITDTVSYENLWTQEQLNIMTEQGKQIVYEDGTLRDQDGNIYDINEKAEYILKGVLMDIETGEPLVDTKGNTYVVYTEPFSPESSDGTHDVIFRLNTADFADEDGNCTLEGKTIVVFEDLYMTGNRDEAEDGEHHIGTHHDLEDEDQDIRFPKGRTHATDGIPEDILAGLTEDQIEALENGHTIEITTTTHEANATGDMTITDVVAFENLHGGTQYTVTGTLQVVTEEDENGNAISWEPARDDNGNVITATQVLDTSSISENFNDHVSGYVTLTFTFSGVNLAGKRTVAFETFEREGNKVIIHADAEDEAQNIFIPKIRTNATDAQTGLHEVLAGKAVVIDKVKYENLQEGKKYILKGSLRNQTDGSQIADAVVEGAFVAGTDNQVITVDGTRVMTEEEMKAYARGEELAGTDIVTDDLAKGDMMDRVDGYVYIAIPVDVTEMAGQTMTVFETLYAPDEDGTNKPVASHEDLEDLAQTIRIPSIGTTAKSGELDEAAVYNAGGTYRDIEIVDTVAYKNLWTQAELDAMAEAADGYGITEKATYILKGVLMDKETMEPLRNADGEEYITYSEPFTPTANDGTVDMKFTVNAGDFVADGKSTLEGKTVVVFEDLYRVGTQEEAQNGVNHVGEHHDIEDDEQDIRFPKVRTHAYDGIPEDVLANASGGYVDVLESLHTGEERYTTHEVQADGTVTLTDYVAYENLHGGTQYKVTGTLQVVTGYDENGNPSTWEPAKDDDGNVITVTETLDTSRVSSNYEDSVSGYIPLTFTFSAVNLAGKTTVVFEDISRSNVVVATHADITDDAQDIYFPSIHTNASDIVSGLDETLASESTVILDRVTYENLEAGKTYTLSGVLYTRSDGEMVEGSEVSGTFVAGVADQYIGEGEYDITASVSAPVDGRVNGEVYVILPVDTSELGGDTVVVFETLYADNGDGSWKEVADHADIEDEDQSVGMPLIHTNAAIDGEKEAVAGGSTIVVDTISYDNLTPSREYVMRGELVDKDSGNATGITAQTTFTPEEADGTVQVTFQFDSTSYAGHKLVVFEELSTTGPDGNEYTVAEHKDINDEAQTVTILAPTGTPSNIKTGDIPVWGYLAGAAVLAVLVIAIFVYRRKKK